MQSDLKEPGFRGVAQLASASGLGPEGPVFESQYPDAIEKQPSEYQMVAFLFSHAGHLSESSGKGQAFGYGGFYLTVDDFRRAVVEVFR